MSLDGYTTANGYGPAWGSTWIIQHDQAGAKVMKPIAVEEYGEDTAYSGVAGWQQTILNKTRTRSDYLNDFVVFSANDRTEIALDIIWDFSAHTQEIGPCKGNVHETHLIPTENSATKRYALNHRQ
jgi:hypothetical protein